MQTHLAAEFKGTPEGEEAEAILRKCVHCGFCTATCPTYQLLGDETFDAAFAGFWWSHVPLQRLAGWLETVHARLEPGARVVLLDNRFVPASSTPISRRDEHGNTYQNRPLDDGSVHEVLKNFPRCDEAFAMLGARARDPQWTAQTHYWIVSYTLA